MRRAVYASAALLAVAVGACCSIPTYSPAFWNSTTQIQWNNNCYNYSNNKRTDTFAQPGQAAGAKWTLLECNNVRTAAVAVQPLRERDGHDATPLLVKVIYK